jgi:hypothetical protein
MSWRGLLRSSGRWRSAGIGTLPAGRHGIAVVRVGGGGAERRTRSRIRRPARTTYRRRNGDDSVERVKLIRDSIGVRRRARVLRAELLFAAQPSRSKGIVEQHGRVRPGRLDGALTSTSLMPTPCRPLGADQGGRSGVAPTRVAAAVAEAFTPELLLTVPGPRGALRPFGQPCPDPTVCGAPITFRCVPRCRRVPSVRQDGERLFL